MKALEVIFSVAVFFATIISIVLVVDNPSLFFLPGLLLALFGIYAIVVKRVLLLHKGHTWVKGKQAKESGILLIIGGIIMTIFFYCIG